MPSTYSPDLRFELPANGEQANTWGTSTNTNIGTLIEQAIAGLVSIDVTAGTVTLLALNGASDQARQAILNIVGSPTSTATVLAPAVSKIYVVANNTTQALKIQTTALGTAFTVNANSASLVYTDGTNFYSAAGNSLPLSGGTITGNLEVDGTLTRGGYTVLNAGNYNAYAPTTSGGNASGTWNISITGSANSAVNATNATNATNSTYASYPSSGGTFITSSNIGSQSVNYANSAGSAPANGGTSTYATQTLGYGQSWQDVTSSRALSTTYTNSTGKPIEVSIFGSAFEYQGLNAYVSGVNVASSYTGYQSYILPYVFAFVVPNGATYYVNPISSAPSGGLAWVELR